MASESVTTWIGLLRQGDESAAQRLWEQYFDRLVNYAQARITDLNRASSDEEDIALSAFHSFIQAVQMGRFPRLHTRDDLWQLLLMHTARKAVTQRRREQSLKRGGPADGPRDVAPLDEIIGHEPDPQFVCQVVDEFQMLLGRLDDELRLVALWKLEGYTHDEIAGRLACSVRSVERKVSIIRGLWEDGAPGAST
jgi:DNA-directed RNA polymerase specialized sigma24 family protein